MGRLGGGMISDTCMVGKVRVGGLGQLIYRQIDFTLPVYLSTTPSLLYIKLHSLNHLSPSRVVIVNSSLSPEWPYRIYPRLNQSTTPSQVR